MIQRWAGRLWATVRRPLSHDCHPHDTYFGAPKQQEETNIRNHPQNKSGQSPETFNRHSERNDVLSRCLRRLREIRWAHHRRSHEARLRWITRRSLAPQVAPRPQPPVPDNLQTAWLDQMKRDHPRWQPGPEACQLACHALVQFFDASAASGHRPCALPSRAADLVWHLWLALDPDGLATWQRIRWGRVIPHHEHGADHDSREALARCLVRTCRLERRSPVRGRLPLLFRLDGLLRTPEGWAYTRGPGGTGAAP